MKPTTHPRKYRGAVKLTAKIEVLWDEIPLDTSRDGDVLHRADCLRWQADLRQGRLPSSSDGYPQCAPQPPTRKRSRCS